MDNIFRDTRLIGEIIREGGLELEGWNRVGAKIEF